MTESHGLSLAMIVRDSEATLAACLASVKPWVDQMTIIDTGSVDGTVEIARSFGAEVYHFPWMDDFSSARNESIRHAKHKWFLYLDSDETISEETGRGLRRLVESEDDPEICGYFLRIVSFSDQFAVLRMIRNHRGFRFERRIHEDARDVLARTGGVIIHSGLTIDHSGYDDPDLLDRKSARNLRLAEMALLDGLDDFKTNFDAARECFSLARFDEAVRYARRAIDRFEPNSSLPWRWPVAWTTLADSLIQAGRFGEARQALIDGLAVLPDEPSLLRARGLLALVQGHYLAARTDYLAALGAGAVGADREVSLYGLGIVRRSVGEIAWFRLIERHRGSRVAARAGDPPPVPGGKTPAVFPARTAGPMRRELT
jgi:hypothetical protein